MTIREVTHENRIDQGTSVEKGLMQTNELIHDDIKLSVDFSESNKATRLCLTRWCIIEYHHERWKTESCRVERS